MLNYRNRKSMSSWIGIILCVLMTAIAVDVANSQARIFTTYEGTYSSIYSYNINDMASLNGTFYMSLQTNNLGNSPATSPTDWLQMGDAVGAATAIGAQSDPLGAGTTAVNLRFGSTLPTSGQIPIGTIGGGSFAVLSLSGDCTLTYAGVLTCLNTNGVPFGTAATTNATAYDAAGTAAADLVIAEAYSANASNLTTGTISPSLISNTIPVTITSSATPALVATNGLQIITLSANATPTITGIVTGGHMTLEICQPSSGVPYTWTWPTAVHGGMTIGTTLSACSVQSFDSFNGTTLVATGAGDINVAP